MNSLPRPTTMFEDVQLFQVAVLKNYHVKPALLDAAGHEHQLTCVAEECRELHEAFEADDLAGVADAIADAVYFLLGYAHKLGLPFDQIWKLVHEANMTKVRGQTKRGVEDDAAKPPGWVDPKVAIAELLRSKP